MTSMASSALDFPLGSGLGRPDPADDADRAAAEHRDVRLVASRPDVREPALRLDRQYRPRRLVPLVARFRGQAKEDLLDRPGVTG